MRLLSIKTLTGSEKWWSQLVFDAMSSRDEFYSFTNEAEEEVARAWVDWRIMLIPMLE